DNLARDALAAGAVLAIHDHEIRRILLAQGRQGLLERHAPRPSIDVADEKDVHGAECPSRWSPCEAKGAGRGRGGKGKCGHCGVSQGTDLFGLPLWPRMVGPETG